jgi:hypothetical protein
MRTKEEQQENEGTESLIIKKKKWKIKLKEILQKIEIQTHNRERKK